WSGSGRCRAASTSAPAGRGAPAPGAPGQHRRCAHRPPRPDSSRSRAGIWRTARRPRRLQRTAAPPRCRTVDAVPYACPSG
ncbi:MAG: hypothetical protein AVDCRST_MAG83-2562, partial [uncultured Arthrobacter sp.]